MCCVLVVLRHAGFDSFAECSIHRGCVYLIYVVRVLASDGPQ